MRQRLEIRLRATQSSHDGRGVAVEVLNQIDLNQMSSLHWMATKNMPGPINTLLHNKAFTASDSADSGGRTALDYAKSGGHAECVKVLEDFGIGKLVLTQVEVEVNPRRFERKPSTA